MIRVRASSLSDYADCPARWYARQILGLSLPSSGAAHLGTSLHRSTGVYDAARVEGRPVSADDAAGVLVEVLRHPEGDVDWAGESVAEAERRGLVLHSRYCAVIAPDRDYRSVELACEPLVVDCEGVTLELTGTADRIRRTPDGPGVSDLKSGARAVSGGRVTTRGHGMQLAMYELLAERTIGERITAPGEIIGLQTAGDPEVASAEVPSKREALVGTPERPGLLDAIAQSIRSGVFAGNPRSMLCTPKYCPAYQSCRWRE